MTNMLPGTRGQYKGSLDDDKENHEYYSSAYYRWDSGLHIFAVHDYKNEVCGHFGI